MTATNTNWPLKLIQKDGSDSKAHVSPEEGADLRSWYRSPDSTGHASAAALIAGAHRAGLWIACGCRPDMPSQPILVPVLADRAKGRYTIRRQVGESDDRPDHGDCCFRFDLDMRATLEREQRQRQMRSELGKNDESWTIPADPAEAALAMAMEDRRARDPGNIGAGQSSIARELWRLQWAGRCEYLENGIAALPGDQIAAIAGKASGLRGPTRHAAMSDILTFDPADIAGNREWRLDRPDTPEGTRPTGFLCALASSIDEDSAHFGQVRIHPVNGLKRPSQFGRDISGPHLVLIACDVSGEKPAPHIGYAQPVLSETCLAPVDSQFERDVGLGIMEGLSMMPRLHPDLEVRVRKPAFSRSVKGGIAKPDFVCRIEHEDGDRIFVIEAMGYEDEDYLASKRITHPRMEEIGPVEEIRYADKPSRADIASWFRKLVEKHSA